MKISKELWSRTSCGKEIFRYTMTNAGGASVVLGSVGAAIVSINVPDRDGKLGDVVIGYPDAESYFADGPCSGKCPGRFANRIAGGRFTLDGKVYTLPVNNGPNHLHGGPEGFQNQVWDSRIDGDAVEFQYFSEDGEAGYPGNLKVVARYEWSENNELRLTLTAKCDRRTVVNLTNHVYFNLDGEGSGTVLDHILRLNASEYLPTDSTLIPLGDSEPVAGTPMDFQNAKTIGRDIKKDFPDINIAKGFDSNYCIDGYMPGQLAEAACRRKVIDIHVKRQPLLQTIGPAQVHQIIHAAVSGLHSVLRVFAPERMVVFVNIFIEHIFETFVCFFEVHML